jgi:hypothetical protein
LKGYKATHNLNHKPSTLNTKQYADNSNLKGYEATDIVQFGDFFSFTKFGGIYVYIQRERQRERIVQFVGCIYRHATCNSTDFPRVSAILRPLYYVFFDTSVKRDLILVSKETC